MKHSQKRTCSGCRAYPEKSYATMCELGIMVTTAKVIYGLPVGFKPAEKCYKPITIPELILATELTEGSR